MPKITQNAVSRGRTPKKLNLQRVWMNLGPIINEYSDTYRRERSKQCATTRERFEIEPTHPLRAVVNPGLPPRGNGNETTTWKRSNRQRIAGCHKKRILGVRETVPMRVEVAARRPMEWARAYFSWLEIKIFHRRSTPGKRSHCSWKERGALFASLKNHATTRGMVASANLSR